MNNVSVIGRATKDTELMTTSSGKKFVSFCIAIPKDNGKKDEASFVDCISWESQAEFICRNVKKGTQVAIQGELETHTYTDRNNVNRKVTEIQIRKIDVIWSKDTNDNQDQSTNETFEVDTDAIPEDAIGDLPFEV